MHKTLPRGLVNVSVEYAISKFTHRSFSFGIFTKIVCYQKYCSAVLKGIVLAKMKTTRPQAIQDVDEFVSSSEI